MRKNSHSRTDCNIMLDEQTREARRRVGRWLWEGLAKWTVLYSTVLYCAQRGRTSPPCPVAPLTATT